MLEFIDPEARLRVDRRGISDETIQHCLEQPDNFYTRADRIVYVSGRLKVETLNGLVVNAFIHR